MKIRRNIYDEFDGPSKQSFKMCTLLYIFVKFNLFMCDAFNANIVLNNL